MNAPQYQPGGAEWGKVQEVMDACSCSRLSAISALKACRNDAATAIKNMTEILPMLSPPASVNEHESLAVRDERKEETATHLASPTSEQGVFDDSGRHPEAGGYPFPSDEPDDCSNAKAEPAHTYGTGKNQGRLVDEVLTQTGVEHVYPRWYASAPPAYSDSLSEPPPPSESRPAVASPLWDFVLPVVHLDISEPDFAAGEGLGGELSLKGFIAGLQSGVHSERLFHSLSYFSEGAVRECLNGTWEGFPTMFYIVATNDEKMMRTFITDYGAPVNIVDNTYQIPLLAFAILTSISHQRDSTALVTTLLSLGADVTVIPRVFYSPYIDDPPWKAPFTSQRYQEFDDLNKRWCSDWIRPILAQRVNLSQRYFLEKTLKDEQPSDRQRQVAVVHRATSLLGISYFMIGQHAAAKSVIQKSLSRLAFPVPRPLVMVFAGPSGHGKSELAKRMGELLSMEMERVDCTEMRHETDMFGPKKPYHGFELGSPLNNFLARLNGKRGIVFLDEFEKTTKEVQNAFLIPFDEGKYSDRRNRTPVECSKVIWILATNALDDTVLNFWDIKQDRLCEPDNSAQQAELMMKLSDDLKKELKSTFGNPLAGRVSVVVPFLPFSPTEAAVVAHKYMLELQQRALQSIQLSDGQQLVGRIQLDIEQDGSICKMIADEGYDANQGARSVKVAVESRITDELVKKYLEEKGNINELQPLVRYAVGLSRKGDIYLRRVS